ncbi:MAG: amidohydrolase family protein [Planctomycetes bacterium]|nr:amidohydrolase family protein [Planctomycetota bacterium]
MRTKSIRSAFGSAVIACAMLAARVPAAETIAIRGGTIHTMAGDPIPNGTVIVRDGRIADAGAGIAIPDGTRILDATDLVITPGFIDAGTWEPCGRMAHEDAREDTIDLGIEDGIEPLHPWIRRALAEGTTSAAVTPDNMAAIGGLAAVIGLRADGIEILRRDAALKIAITGEVGQGNASTRGGVTSDYRYRRPTTRMGILWLLRRRFLEAGEGKPSGETEGPAWIHPEAPTDLARLEAGEIAILRRAMAGDLPLRAAANLRSDIEAALRLAREYRIPRITIDGAYEAADMLRELRADGARVVLGPHFDVPTRYVQRSEGDGYVWNLAAQLAEAGIPFAFSSGGGSGERAGVRGEAIHAVRAGLAPDAALRALTRGAAEIVGIDARAGTIERGKRADLVAWSGPVLEWTTRAVWVMTAGEVVDAPGRGSGD